MATPESLINFSLVAIVGVWDLEFYNSYENQIILTKEFQYYGQVKNTSFGEGFGYL